MPFLVSQQIIEVDMADLWETVVPGSQFSS